MALRDPSFPPKVRREKVAIKDAKLRTFITRDDARDDLVAHVYDITYGSVRAGVNNLVVVDDSIIARHHAAPEHPAHAGPPGAQADRGGEQRPAIRYPDCYGIDMAKLGDLVAFRRRSLLKETKQENIIDDVYERCLAEVGKPLHEVVNHVKDIYRPFTAQQIGDKITELLTPARPERRVRIYTRASRACTPPAR